ncbi:MAG: Gfo/Idh/MocA family protein [Tepidisphaerales bacterium]
MDKVRIGFVGAGWMGAVQLQRLAARQDVEVLYLLEPNAQRAREALDKAGLTATALAQSYDQLLADPRVDAVWLVSPNGFHAPQAIAAMQAGRHVFCEKPAATRLPDFLREIELEEASPSLITFVDYILYFDSMEQRLRRMVADGLLGQISQIQINYRHPVNIAGDKTWKLKQEIMGDAIVMGINHALSAMLWIMEANGARPVGVTASSHNAHVRGFEADPVWNIFIRFDTGACGVCLGNIDYNNGYDAYHNISGTHGAFIFDSGQERPAKVRYWSAEATAGKWLWPLDVPRCQAQGQEPWPPDTTTPDSGNVVAHQTAACVGHFIDCVKSGTRSPLSFANSRLIGELGWAARVSAALGGREVRLPLDYTQAMSMVEG